jgi:hypothetical protein
MDMSAITWALLIVIVAVVVIMSMSSRGQVPWGSKMRRIHAGVAHKAEWMAPDEVVSQVSSDYLVAVGWMHDTMLSPRIQQLKSATHHLSGTFLKQHQHRLMQPVRFPPVIGVLRADHHLSVRRFSEDGETCLVVDHQTQRRMATYDARTHARILTQDLGMATLVYSMRFDVTEKRWKIDAFIQELPIGWRNQASSRFLREQAILPTTIGRDN